MEVCWDRPPHFDEYGDLGEMFIKEIEFTIPSGVDVERFAHVQCTNDKIYYYIDNFIKIPQSSGVVDRRLGTLEAFTICDVCGKTGFDCPGHFGVISLALPIFHPAYIKTVTRILSVICKNCARVLLTPNDKTIVQNLLNNTDVLSLKEQVFNQHILNRFGNRVKYCPYCKAECGIISSLDNFKILYERRKNKERARLEKQGPQETWFSKVMNPLCVLELFRRIPDEDLRYLNVASNCRPENLILQKIPVPPLSLRPPNKFQDGLFEYRTSYSQFSVTYLLNNIISTNNWIKKNISSSVFDVMDHWNLLQEQCALYMTDSLKETRVRGTTSLQFGINQRLGGKEGRFRGNLSGKRTDYSSRAVITPDPNLRIDQVGIPQQVAKILTYPEKVTKINIERMRMLVRNGLDVYPGANSYLDGESGIRWSLKYADRNKVATRLKPNDIVERHMRDGDTVLFNRQPSLHRPSMMAPEVKLLPDRNVFSFNPCVCAPFNADFDGDEMNVHFPQTLEAMTEAKILMGPMDNAVSPKNGEPLIAPTQDLITGTFLLTCKDRFLDRSQACQLISSFLVDTHATVKIDLPSPAIQKPAALWTGKQIFSIILKPNKKHPVSLNICAKGKLHLSGGDMCPNDSYVIICNSNLLCGAMDKNTMGSGSKSNVFHEILKEYGEVHCADAMWRMGKVVHSFLTNFGFSLGIDDINPTRDLLNKKENIIRNGYSACNEHIEVAEIEKSPREDEELERKILKELSIVRDSAGKACLKELPKTNAALIMASCGSKGSLVNISQMTALVGQQAIDGTRIFNGFQDRTLPHFKRGSKQPKSHGFIENSFCSGLNPHEFYFHAMAGRQDTSTKTSNVGYMQRRLVKNLENLIVHYDMTVRDVAKNVIQFSYGEDNINPLFMDSPDVLVCFPKLLDHTKVTHPSHGEDALTGQEILHMMNESVLNQKTGNATYSPLFRERLKDFLISCARRTEELCNKPGVVIGALRKVECITRTQLCAFLHACQRKYQKAVIEPGTPVGILCAQSLGEPATQMTLKSFHFAGLETMSITQGLPRMNEIINATEVIKTPVITVALENEFSEEFARLVKGRVEKTTLGQVCQTIDEIYVKHGCGIKITLATELISILKLEVNVKSICCSIEKARNIAMYICSIIIVDDHTILITPISSVKMKVSYILQLLKDELPNIVIAGVPTVSKSFVQVDDSGLIPKYKLLAQGSGLRHVMSVPGVKANSTVSNSIHEVNRVLGIEAVRTLIIRELKCVMEGHGLAIDPRHYMLLADNMTYLGKVTGAKNSGLVQRNESAFTLASFETSSAHMYKAALHGRRDPVIGVSDRVIFGLPVAMGTGLCKLIQKVKKSHLPLPRKTLF